MTLANRLLNNLGLVALTVSQEKDELLAISPLKKRKIKFAHFQDDFKGGRIPYWHTNWYMKQDGSEDFGTTLSMEGLKQWGWV